MERCVTRHRAVWLQIRTLKSDAKPRGSSLFIHDARTLVKSKKVTVLNDGDSINKTKLIVKETQRKYFDPSNKTLDFSLLNKQLFTKILRESKDRTSKRVNDPSQTWTTSQKSPADISRKMKKYLTYGRVSLRHNLSPLSVGDLVLLGEQSTLLHIVVATPQTLDSDTYTFIDNEGEITYGTKHHIKLRIPQIIPKKFLESLGLITLEKKYAGLAPIGMPDSKFSRSVKSLPENLRSENQKNSAPSSGAEFSNSGDDFIVAQATSQLLTDTDVKTYIVPTSARKVFSEYLKNASIVSFCKVTAFMNKLEYFHKVLQYDENNNLLDSSRTIPIFELLDYVSNFDETLEVIKKVKGHDEEYQIINSYIRGFGFSNKTTFGKKLSYGANQNFADSSHSLSSYIAFIVALSRSGRLWKVNTQKSTKTPISVEILPVQKLVSLTDTLNVLKGGEAKKFVHYYVKYMKTGDLTNKPPHYEAILQMFKDFIVPNIYHDRTMESVMGSLIRSIDRKLENEGLHQKHTIPYAYEYSKSRAFEIVNSLEKGGYSNPIQWSDSLKLPNSGNSPESDLYWQYYAFLDSKYKTKSDLLNDLANPEEESCWLQNEFHADDRLQHVREDFGNIPIYCIDSATAHEIDDGISIHTDGEKYVFTIHVANPTSYVKKKSIISEIAFSKGTTVYLPEGPTMMLPQLMSRMCGLNGDANTRTFAIQFDLDRSEIDDYLRNLDETKVPKSSLAKRVLSRINSTSKVKFFMAHNFPQNFTYENVNKVLNNEENIAKFKRGEFAEGSHEQNLFTLYHVSSIIKHIRIALGGGLELNSEKPKVRVDYMLEETPEKEQFKRIPGGYTLALPKGRSEKTPIITITEDVDQDSRSKSQQLVSNFMIAANFAGLHYAHKNKIPIIHRTQELGLEKGVEDSVRILNQSLYEGRKSASVEQKAQILSILTAANYEVTRKRHESLGLTSYLNLTSPLRRYVDMVNHWMFEERAMKREDKGDENAKREDGRDITEESSGTTASDLDYIASHLQSCELTNKLAQRFSDKFWKGTFLKSYFEKLHCGKIADPIQFSILLRSDAKHGDIRAEILGFSDLRTTVVQNDYVISMFASGAFKVGQVVTSKFRVIKLDFLEDEFTIELHE
ncbi:CIC11C00000003051 [Sungouiella intermedia]|uniref:CIC11C00000003051 n=1 Tax=Sungouiella intermedia TaxID=45354 RepID=A0A1L0DCH4_9ASCO|nr:CIC11C00000003051 [[Candida] intermedia]